MISLPDPLLVRLGVQLGDTLPEFLTSLQTPPPVSVRGNRRKPATIPGEAVVPWCPSGQYLNARPVFALDPLWHAGTYYVQEASSMLLSFALRQSFSMSLPRRVLDLCAAPGGKTTLLADFLADDALLVANEVIRSRAKVLKENVTRWGWPNIVVTEQDPRDFAPLTGFFDLVVVDAPCSGEGLFRKEAGAVREWSVETANLCAARQARILEYALPLVCPGGLLMYSTCTYNPAENDARVAEVLSTDDWQIVPLATPPEWGMLPTKYGLHCWPHRVRGEGFYLAVLQRPGERRLPSLPSSLPLPSSVAPLVLEAVPPFLSAPDDFFLQQEETTGDIVAIPKTIAADVAYLRTHLRHSSSGLPIATQKRNDFVPRHELAVSVAAHPGLPALDLSLPDALTYLRKDTLTLPDDTETGWLLARYAGHNLGWLKHLPGRTNNYLPTEWRLRIART